MVKARHLRSRIINSNFIAHNFSTITRQEPLFAPIFTNYFIKLHSLECANFYEILLWQIIFLWCYQCKICKFIRRSSKSQHFSTQPLVFTVFLQDIKPVCRIYSPVVLSFSIFMSGYFVVWNKPQIIENVLKLRQVVSTKQIKLLAHFQEFFAANETKDKVFINLGAF